MMIATWQHMVVTSHGCIAVEESGEGGLPLLMIHANSSCREAFRKQLQGGLAGGRRLITFDLPGHGESTNAPDPMRSYTRPGFAEAVVELLEKLGVAEAVVFGWSLGGHVGIEMMSRFPGMRGLMITGTPPVRRNNMAQGFVSPVQGGVAGREILSEADIDAFAKMSFGEPVEPFIRNAIVRADGRFRKRLFEAGRAGAGVDQHLTVETNPLPLAVVNGAADPLINLDYIDGIAYANLWERRCHRIAGLGHAPFWNAAAFDPILERFLHDIDTGRAVLRPSGPW
jgi:pimeloyl-ACP methyl ester carboxylesterase